MAFLTDWAKAEDIHDIAVCHAGDFQEVRQLLYKDRKLGILPPFTERDIDRRVSPGMTLPGAKSFIVILESYVPPVYKDDGKSGNISPAAAGPDYHRIVREKLERLAGHIKKELPDCQFIPFVDDSPFSEKHVAIRAGLGRLMKNGLFYSARFGSRCYIGLILTDRPVAEWEMPQRRDGQLDLFDRCLSCQACVKACPGGALTEKGINSYRCVSYLTQKKEDLDNREKRALGKQIYGCDVCQKVCPLNPHIPAGYETGEAVDLTALLSMTNREFHTRYRSTAAGWRGKKILQRNARIVRENLGLDEEIPIQAGER